MSRGGGGVDEEFFARIPALSLSQHGWRFSKKRRLPAPERAHIYEIDLKSG